MNARPDPETDAMPTRRDLLQDLRGALALGAGAGLFESEAAAQGAGGPELRRLEGARRMALRGGVVLTLDPKIGDFVRADVLIEDGKIREIAPDIAMSAEAAAIVDAAHRVVIPGFVDTHSHSYQGRLPPILANASPVPDSNQS